MKKIILCLIAICILTVGCSKPRLKSVFKCFDTDGNKQDITLTYEGSSPSDRIFYDGDTKIGYRTDAINYASEKTGGMICHSGTDREK